MENNMTSEEEYTSDSSEEEHIEEQLRILQQQLKLKKRVRFLKTEARKKKERKMPILRPALSVEVNEEESDTVNCKEFALKKVFNKNGAGIRYDDGTREITVSPTYGESVSISRGATNRKAAIDFAAKRQAAKRENAKNNPVKRNHAK